MRRREFVAGTIGAVACPLMARAQSSAMPVIALVRSSSLLQFDHLVTAFRQGLKEMNFVEGLNVIVEYRSAEDRHEQLPELVADLVRRRVDVIVGNIAAALAAKAATSTIPIVFTTGGDPLKEGLVVSLNHPGANVTGVTFFGAVLGAKRLECLRQHSPKPMPTAILRTPNSPSPQAERRGGRPRPTGWISNC